MDSNFIKIRKRVGQSEGGYSYRSSNDDPGGETNFGISKRAYPLLDIKGLTYEDATKIFYEDYYLKPKLNLITDVEKVYPIFDFLVHSGQYNAISILQRTLNEMTKGNLKIDGVFGPLTNQVLTNADTKKFVLAYTLKRWEFVKKLKNFEANKNGWLKRMDYILSFTNQKLHPILNHVKENNFTTFIVGTIGIFFLFH